MRNNNTYPWKPSDVLRSIRDFGRTALSLISPQIEHLDAPRYYVERVERPVQTEQELISKEEA